MYSYMYSKVLKISLIIYTVLNDDTVLTDDTFLTDEPFWLMKPLRGVHVGDFVSQIQSYPILHAPPILRGILY